MADGSHVIFVGKPLTLVGKKQDRGLRSDKKDAMLKSMSFNPFPWVWEGHTRINRVKVCLGRRLDIRKGRFERWQDQ